MLEGGLVLLRTRSLRYEPLQGTAQYLERLADLLVARLKPGHKRSCYPHRQEIAVNAVRKPAFFTDLLAQTRDKTTAPKRVIADIEGIKVRIEARYPRLTKAYMGLARGMGDLDLNRCR